MACVVVERAARAPWWMVLLLALAAAAPAQAGRTVKTEVRFVHPEAVYLGAGREDGLRPGQIGEVIRQGRRVARVRIEAVAAHRAMAAPEGDFRARRGDVVRITDAAPPPAPRAAAPPGAGPGRAPAPARVAAAGIPFPLVRDRARPGRPWRRRAQAFLSTDGWAYLGGSQPAVTGRARLLLRMDLPLDSRDRLHATVHAHLVTQPLVLEGGALQPASVFWTEVYEAALAWRPGGGVELGAGRAPAPGLRYGLVDGIFVGWRFHDALALRVSVGERADLVTLLPGLERPVLAGSADGVVRGGWGALGYRAALSWLGRDVVAVEGAEASGHFLLELARLLWVDGDVAAVAWVPRGGALPGVTLERLGLAATARQGPLSVRGYGRRHASAGLTSELSRPPAGYLPGQPFFEVGASSSLALGTRWAGAVELDAGGVWDPSHARDRIYLVPQVRGRLLPLWSLSARAAYRAELGSTGAQLASFAVDAEPVAGARVSLWQQGGVIIVQDGPALEDVLVDRGTRRVLWTYAWAATADYRMLGVLVTGVRTRGLYGTAGKGIELGAFVGTDRLP
ncbi:MAG: hypothetical protein HY904_01345 [Deltaproteobacteria bacterium]|nr:hypothetical protein [Deltaproteobacteria bacterium]